MKKLFALILFLSFVTVSKAQVINFPDIRFKNYLLSGINTYDVNNFQIDVDQNDNGEIEVSEALLIYAMQPQCVVDCDNGGTINSIVGIEYFTNLRYLQISYSNINTIDLTSLTLLEQLTCSGNNISNININGLNSLNLINCSQNNLTSIDFINNHPLIQNISANNNQLTSVNLNGLQNLIGVNVANNNINSLVVQNTPQLNSLWCHNNNLQNLEVNELTSLTSFVCNGNLLTTIDVTNLPLLQTFNFSNNPLLETILMKNGSYQLIDYSIGLNSINYVCADESEIEDIQAIFNSNNYTDYTVNSYCSFVPGGEYFVISGNSILDNNLNGCDSSDSLLSNLRINITDGTNSGNFIANASGQYSIPVQQGTHTLTPSIENPAYFNISPSSFQVTFPTQASPFTQNFCITPNGSHQDVETWIVPLTPARPGFDARYKIFYKNKGNLTVTGSLSFAFDDDDMDFVSAIPIQNNQSYSLLSWNYSNLLPFEIREIEVTVNINSPMETPAVNNGDFLKFSSTIFPLTGDEYPNNNSIGLNQLVVGSFDPNDKTCIEGRFVEPEMIGEYVHYVIRFENTGTFAAENIVVKDIIDETKFDISTLVPLNASHNFTTRIAGSKVEFIFENINLPFDDENNDGYVAFKIKTKSTLALGNTFSNTASIYFDYNFPIITNTTATTIQRLANQDFEFSKYFTLYPNPANETLHIKSSNSILVHSLSIYNTLGQLLMVVANPIGAIDVSILKSGNYYLKISSDKGTSSSRFVKI